MTHEITVVAGLRCSDEALAWDLLSRLGSDADDPVPEISRFCDRLRKAHPVRDAAPPSTAGGRRPSALVRNDHVVLTLDPGAVDLFAIITMAHEEGLAVIDRRTSTFHAGDGYVGIRMTMEGRPDLMAPRMDQVVAGVAALTPAGGPSYLVLCRREADYTQIAGGDGHFAFEWREYRGNRFRHWAAGYGGERMRGRISVMTNGYHVPVRSNENMQALDVEILFHAFLTRAGRPTQYRWRDMTSEFQP